MKKTPSALWPDCFSPPAWLPDWREEDEYSRIASHTEIRFDLESQTGKRHTEISRKPDYAWEFLRRNPLYQTDYQYLINLCKQEGVIDHHKKALGLNIFLNKDDPPPSMHFHVELYRVLRKWGMWYYLLDPSFAIHDTGSYAAVRRIGNDIYPAVNVLPFPVEGDDTKLEPIPVDGGICPGDTEWFWLFDISLPLEPQLHQAKVFLESAQKRSYGKKLQASKTDPRKFLLYLRILDADARGADDREIMAVLMPGEDSFSYTDKSGSPYKRETSHRNPGRDLLKNYRNAAYSLRDEGYRRLFE